jgi:hypothetical protein
MLITEHSYGELKIFLQEYRLESSSAGQCIWEHEVGCPPEVSMEYFVFGRGWSGVQGFPARRTKYLALG